MGDWETMFIRTGTLIFGIKSGKRLGVPNRKRRARLAKRSIALSVLSYVACETHCTGQYFLNAFARLGQ